LKEYNSRAAVSAANQADLFGGGVVKDKRTIIEEVVSLYETTNRLSNTEKNIMEKFKQIVSGGADATIATTADEITKSRNELDNLLDDVC